MSASRTRITSVQFSNYKPFKDYSASFREFNVLVGPNNAGKSTILGALRILSEGMRKARSRNPQFVSGPKGKIRGYSIDLSGLPDSTENVFHNYNDSEAAVVTFRISNGNELLLWFPEQGVCYMFTESQRPVRSTSDFRREFPFFVAFVPVLGPVEHNEQLNEAETARRALFTHNASRNFRNIWHHFPEGFTEFKETIQSTWTGMDIDPPEVGTHNNKAVLHMFCPEERFPRELFWAGFGFQVWCQLLTFILRSKDVSLLIIDEPDIYLHSDLQRQLVHILQELGPDILLATHSTEIICEVEPEAILNVNKRFRSARRVQNSHELEAVFSVLGSNLNPTLTQLAKTKRVVFVEGKDFLLFARFARKLGIDSVANRSHFAVVPVGGFNPQKVKNFASGMELTLGVKLIKIVIFDRDFRCDAEVAALTNELNSFCWYAVVHSHKEIENYLLHPGAIARAIARKAAEHERTPSGELFDNHIEPLLLELTEAMKNRVQAQLVTARQAFERQSHPGIHPSSISEAAMNDFDAQWGNWRLISGKETLSALNRYLQESGNSAITPLAVIEAFRRDEVPHEMVSLITKIAEAKNAPIEEPLDSELI
jgi:energy-coupling factor transporter ATP-binding protein EcfA2